LWFVDATTPTYLAQLLRMEICRPRLDRARIAPAPNKFVAPCAAKTFAALIALVGDISSHRCESWVLVHRTATALNGPLRRRREFAREQSEYTSSSNSPSIHLNDDTIARSNAISRRTEFLVGTPS